MAKLFSRLFQRCSFIFNATAARVPIVVKLRSIVKSKHLAISALIKKIIKKNDHSAINAHLLFVYDSSDFGNFFLWDKNSQ